MHLELATEDIRAPEGSIEICQNFAGELFPVAAFPVRSEDGK